MVKLWYKYFDSLTYRSDTGDYIGKFTFHTGVRNDVPGGGLQGLGQNVFTLIDGPQESALIRLGSDFAPALFGRHVQKVSRHDSVELAEKRKAPVQIDRNGEELCWR